MVSDISPKMNTWLGQLGTELRSVELELESAEYAVKELKEARSAKLRKICLIHHGSHMVPSAIDSFCIVDFDVYSYLSKDKNSVGTLRNN